MNRLITLTTDFGLEDAFVGVLKGVILGINPAARIVDICHNIGPQNVGEGAFSLATAYPYFPPDTIHVAVVDPGVGTSRRPIAIATPTGFFVGPDNGVFTYVLANITGEGGFETRPDNVLPRGRSYDDPKETRPDRRRRDDPAGRLHPSPMPGDLFGNHETGSDNGLTAIHLTERRFWLPNVSATFHGRDIFAPVAAHLSLGVPIEQLGVPITDLETFPISRPHRIDEGTMVAHVIHVDRFGNLITDARPGDLPPPPIAITIKGRVIAGVSTSYADRDGLVAVIDSSDRLEIAARNGNAAKELRAGVGEDVRIERTA